MSGRAAMNPCATAVMAARPPAASFTRSEPSADKNDATPAASCVLLVAVGAVAIAENDNASEQLAGTWWAKVDFEGAQILTYVAQFIADGRANIILPSGPPAAGGGWSETRVACPGEWRPAGHRQFDVTLYCLASAQDYGMVPDRIRLKLTLAQHGKSFTAPFRYEWWMVDHYEGGNGVEYGSRLPVVPLK